MKKIVPVFFAVDDNFVKYTVVALQSMIENASKNYQYNIYVLNTNVSDKYKNILYDMANENFNIEFVNVNAYVETIKDKLPIRDYYSLTTYYRVFIPEMFKQYDKVIYIDSDVVVNGDISKLYTQSLGDAYLGVFKDKSVQCLEIFQDYVENVLGVKHEEYFNAGVLLMNAKKFREVKMLDQFIDMINFYTFRVAQDQDYLNVLCNHKTKFLKGGWDTQVFGDEFDEENLDVLHYVHFNKPWHDPNCKFKEYFWDYASRTNVYEEIKEVLASYTDEARAKDQAGLGNLVAMVQSEIERPDNYLRRITSNVNAFVSGALSRRVLLK